MAPRERRNNSCSIAESKGSDAEEASCLQDLPLSAQSLVYKYLDGRARNALLCSSRWGMDLVLREVKAIRLILRDIDKAARRKPLLRLLGKALRSASAGLSVAVMSSKEVTIRGASAWIEEAARLPGWSSIKELMIEVGFDCCDCSKGEPFDVLLPSTRPCRGHQRRDTSLRPCRRR
jgi:hypothetical protein